MIGQAVVGDEVISKTLNYLILSLENLRVTCTSVQYDIGDFERCGLGK